jgi:hypothetical protein
MAVSEDFNAIPTPAITPYVDELMLSPEVGQSNNSSTKPSPELMISPPQEPQPSLEIYKDQDSININLTPTPPYAGGTLGDFGNLFPGILIAVALAVFISGVVFAIKNNLPKK